MPEPEVLADRYELRRLIGRGATADVYEGYDRLLGRTVAVKRVPREPSDPETTERVRREARAVAALSHPHIVALHDLVLAPQTAFLVLEFLDGPSLAQVLRDRSRLPATEARDIAVQVCAGLAAAHARGLVHRDVTPGNILFAGVGTVKLTDFGIAHGVPNAFLTGAGLVSGTPAFMSPEQIRGSELDGRSDLYSLGCCLHLMLTGLPPFPGESAAELASAHLRDRPAPPRAVAADVPVDLDAVVTRAMAKRPAERFPDAEAMAAALGAVPPHPEGGDGTVNRPGPTVLSPTMGQADPRAPSTARFTTDPEEFDEVRVPPLLRRRTALLLVLLALLIALIAVALLLTGR